MALFKRNKDTEQTTNDAIMPQELQDYYQAETRERSWMAWLLGLATLVITVLLALGLFYGGRFAYRKIRNTDSQSATVQKDDTSDEATSATDSDNASDDGDETADNNSSESEEVATTPSTTATSSTSTTTPRAATPQPTATMPSTGPANTLAIFMVASILAYIAHRRFLTN